ncbi:MAG: hypothetical protein EBV05_00580 [Cyanobacteria bacterium WB6_1B_304]|nr:hypothetical protein [Cyanobacteria bacterium WB6_1B_304]
MPIAAHSYRGRPLNHWGELLRRHWNYALGKRLDWLCRTDLNLVQAVGVKRGKHPQEVDARSTSIQCFNCEKSIVKELSIPVHDCPNGGVSVDRD